MGSENEIWVLAFIQFSVSFKFHLLFSVKKKIMFFFFFFWWGSKKNVNNESVKLAGKIGVFFFL